MAIPQKKPVNNSPVYRLGRFLISIPGSFIFAAKEIPNLPKLKLLKLTGYFFLGSGIMYFLHGPYKRIKYLRHVRDGEELYASVGIRDTSSLTGTEKPYSGQYTFDYREEIDKSKSKD